MFCFGEGVIFSLESYVLKWLNILTCKKHSKNAEFHTRDDPNPRGYIDQKVSLMPKISKLSLEPYNVTSLKKEFIADFNSAVDKTFIFNKIKEKN